MVAQPEQEPLRMRCARLEDRAAIGAAAFQFARGMGFSRRACWEIGICVQELVSNIVRHAGSGFLELSAQGRCLEVCATDEGPGIPEAAIAASHDSQRGLGAIRRLMHEVHITPAAPHGTCVRVRRCLDRSP